MFMAEVAPDSMHGVRGAESKARKFLLPALVATPCINIVKAGVVEVRFG